MKSTAMPVSPLSPLAVAGAALRRSPPARPSARTCCRSTARRRRATRRSPPRARSWEATQERVPQARAGPAAQRVARPAPANVNNYDVDDQHATRRPDFNRNYYQYSLTVSASQPLYRYQNVVALRPGEAAGRAVGLHAGHRAAGPHHPHVGRVFRRAARPVQRRARRAAEAGGGRAARAGEAQLRGRHGDDHRHQRSAGEVRPDRRAGDPGAQRPRQPAHGAARDHRPLPEAA